MRVTADVDGATSLQYTRLFIMSSLQARTGRQRQRYQDQFRLVAGLEKDVEDHSCDLESRLKVLMISSPNRDDLGGWEDDETVLEAACREALEEAGVKGILDLISSFGLCFVPQLLSKNDAIDDVPPFHKQKSLVPLGRMVPILNLEENPLGVWEFRSKSRQDSCSLEGGCRGYMFALEVTEELETWPEQDNHDRKWLTVREAIGLCRYEWMRIALGIFLGVMSEDRKDETTEELVGHPSMPVPDDITEHEILSPNCLVKSSGTQHLDESLNCSVLGNDRMPEVMTWQPEFASRGTSYWRSMLCRLGGRQSFATSTTPKMKHFVAMADVAQAEEHTKTRSSVKGEFAPVYVALGMVVLALSIGAHTAKQQLMHSPAVHVSKKKREIMVEVEDPDHVVDEADKFINKSFFRKVAHIQEYDHLDHASIRADPFTRPRNAETLKSVGVDPSHH
ncbi:hypothetical protein HHK36_007685 [Tetracentron sinense]|uniref:Nudix hydrolase domain-containing protein n=1 Tax=Tetracentron sinense TaxID=13715 RepID=A0A835DQ24_TETSI|nr:hypothetical protein HHK36_007685 [Tetracentron sinense]